ncbi:Hypothetical protein (Fragment) [Durusdinium trenchii]
MRANPLFRDGRSLEKAIEEIQKVPWSGSCEESEKPVWRLKAPFPPIEVMKWRCKLRDEATGRPLVDPATGGELLDAEDKWYTLDNRRLYCLQKVAASLWPDRAVAEVCCLPPGLRGSLRRERWVKPVGYGPALLEGAQPTASCFSLVLQARHCTIPKKQTQGHRVIDCYCA